ncbi:hypothetical protein DFH06DRAFT_1482163, partial [Mycena polygramma]
ATHLGPLLASPLSLHLLHPPFPCRTRPTHLSTASLYSVLDRRRAVLALAHASSKTFQLIARAGQIVYAPSPPALFCHGTHIPCTAYLKHQRRRCARGARKTVRTVGAVTDEVCLPLYLSSYALDRIRAPNLAHRRAQRARDSAWRERELETASR